MKHTQVKKCKNLHPFIKAVLLSATVLVVFTACGSKKVLPAETPTGSAPQSISEEPVQSISAQTTDSSLAEDTEDSTSLPTTSVPQDSSAPELVDGMRPEFKEAMDSYEAFFDEYIAFMKKYETSDNPAAMLLDYTRFMTQYADTMAKMDAMDEETMNDTELAYYTKTTLAIAQKLATV